MGQHAGFEVTVGSWNGGIERTGHPQDGVEVRFRRDPKLRRGHAKGMHVAPDNLPVERQALPRGAVQIQGQLDMAASQFFLEPAPQLHFEGVGVGRQAEVDVEKAVIHGLEREREAEATCGFSQDPPVARWLADRRAGL